MNKEKQLFTISVYTENNIGLLNRISAIFQRRHINIESLNISPSEIEGVAKFTIVVHMTEENVKKIIGQIEKQVEVVALYNQLSVFGIMQYTRSGRVAITKEEMKISELLETYNN